MDIWSKRCVRRKVINEMFFMAYFLVDVMDKATSTQLCLLNDRHSPTTFSIYAATQEETHIYTYMMSESGH